LHDEYYRHDISAEPTEFEEALAENLMPALSQFAKSTENVVNYDSTVKK
jgi:hypothetical protein